MIIPWLDTIVLWIHILAAISSIAHDFFLGPRQHDLGRRLRQIQPPSQLSSEQASAAPALGRLRRWTVLIAQLNLVLGVLVILLAASLQSF